MGLFVVVVVIFSITNEIVAFTLCLYSMRARGLYTCVEDVVH